MVLTTAATWRVGSGRIRRQHIGRVTRLEVTARRRGESFHCHHTAPRRLCTCRCVEICQQNCRSSCRISSSVYVASGRVSTGNRPNWHGHPSCLLSLRTKRTTNHSRTKETEIQRDTHILAVFPRCLKCNVISIHSASELFGRCDLQIYLLTYLLTCLLTYQLRLGRQRQVWFIPSADESGVCR